MMGHNHGYGGPLFGDVTSSLFGDVTVGGGDVTAPKVALKVVIMFATKTVATNVYYSLDIPTSQSIYISQSAGQTELLY